MKLVKIPRFFIVVVKSWNISEFLFSDEQVQINDIPNIIEKITDLLDSCENNANYFFRDINADNATDCLMDAAVLKMNHDLVSGKIPKIPNETVMLGDLKLCVN